MGWTDVDSALMATVPLERLGHTAAVSRIGARAVGDVALLHLVAGTTERTRRVVEQTLLLAAEDLDVEATRSETAPGAACRCGQFAFIGAGVRCSAGDHRNLNE